MIDDSALPLLDSELAMDMEIIAMTTDEILPGILDTQATCIENELPQKAV